MYLLVDENVVTTGSEEPNPVFSLEAIIQYLLFQYSHSQ